MTDTNPTQLHENETRWLINHNVRVARSALTGSLFLVAAGLTANIYGPETMQKASLLIAVLALVSAAYHAFFVLPLMRPVLRKVG